MSNLFDYLQWRGDLRFYQDPVNDIDVLIFALLSYIPLKGIVPGCQTNQSISLKIVSERYFSKDGKSEKENLNLNPTSSVTFDSELERLLFEVAKYPRFSRVFLSNYEENTDFIIGEQFGVVTFTLKDVFDLKVIAFRGTDNSLIGWKEDCQLAYMEQTHAQESARKYVDRTLGFFSRKAILCGHSKGGNLAMYAGLTAASLQQKNILKVLNFDGPGFDFTIQDRQKFDQHAEKITSYLPTESVVGMLLEPIGNREILSSTSRLMNQHNAFFWQLEGRSFISAELSSISTFIDKTIKTWLAEKTLEERKTFVEALFDILGASDGAVVLTPSPENLKVINKVVTKYADLNPEARSVLTQFFVSLTGQITNQTKMTLSATINEKFPRKKEKETSSDPA